MKNLLQSKRLKLKPKRSTSHKILTTWDHEELTDVTRTEVIVEEIQPQCRPLHVNDITTFISLRSPIMVPLNCSMTRCTVNKRRPLCLILVTFSLVTNCSWLTSTKIPNPTKHVTPARRGLQISQDRKFSTVSARLDLLTRDRHYAISHYSSSIEKRSFPTWRVQDLRKPHLLNIKIKLIY